MAIRAIETAASTTERDAKTADIKTPFTGLVFRTDIAALDVKNPATGTFTPVPSALTGEQTLQTRSTIAAVNAGATLLPAVPGFKYRIVDMSMIAIGGAAGASTTVDILATKATVSSKLLAVAIAALTQSALVRAGAANATILADGASFTENDTNTAITIAVTGAALTTATHIDTEVRYVLVAA